MLLYYPQFDLCRIDADGYRLPMPGVDVDYFNITKNVLIDTLTSDSDGILASGSFDTSSDPVALNDVVELRHDTYGGTARFRLQASEDDAVLAVENHVSTYILENLLTTQEPDAAVLIAEDPSEPDAAPKIIGTAKVGGATVIPVQIPAGKSLRIYIKARHKDFDFHAAALEQLNSLTLDVTDGSGDSPPTLTSAAYDTPNSEVDLVFAKNGTATGNIEVEYKKSSESSWTTHGTSFAHGATSGSVIITEEPTAQTYDIRLKQVGVAGYSVTRQVTVDASGGGTPPSNLVALFNDDACSTPEVDLSWTAGSGSGNYTVERKLGSGGSWSTLSAAVATTNYTDTALLPSGISRTYYYRVKQNDVTGYSSAESVWIPKC